jgi:mannosyltransferase
MKRSGKLRSSDRAVILICGAALFAVPLGARLYGLDAKPLWLDEVLTAQRAALAVPALIGDSIRNDHSPLFFLIEHVVGSVVPGSTGLRLVPAFAGALSAPLVFAVGRAAGLTAGAVLGGLFAALAPLQVAFGQEARPYTLMIALILIALWGLVQLAAKPSRATLPWSKSDGSRAAWLAYGLGTAGALVIHGDALLWLVVSNVAMFATIFPRVTPRRSFLLCWTAVQGAIVIACAPVYLAIVTVTKGAVFDSFLWIPPLTMRFLWADVASLYGLRAATMVTMQLLPSPIPYLAPIAIAVGVIGFIRLRRARGPRAVLLIATTGLPLILGFLSLRHPILMPRYLLWSALPFFAIAGAAIEALPAGIRSVALGVGAGMLCVNLAPYYQAETKPRWDLAAAFLSNQLRSDDIVLVADSSAYLMLKFYLGHSVPTVASSNLKWRAIVTSRIAESGRIWAVYGPAGQAMLSPESAFFSQVRALGVPGNKENLGKEIAIERIDPSSEVEFQHSAGNSEPSGALP